MTHTYCCYFDHRYLARGVTMIRSLRRHEREAEVWVLCLNDSAFHGLSRLNEPGIRLVALEEIEENDEALLRAKADGRSLVEYYFTLTPSLIRHVMSRSGADMVTYLDSDLYFFGSPQPIYDELGGASVLIIPHHFAPAMEHLERYGRYNVGWLSFRNDTSASACLTWWRDRSNEWCSDVVDEEGNRYCEQRYLDRFADNFPGVHVLAHPGANLAPWNVAARRLSLSDTGVLIDGRPLIFFHFHGLKRIGRQRFYAIHWEYRAPMTEFMRAHIYQPYLVELLAVERATKDFVGGQGDMLRGAGVRQGGRPAAGLQVLAQSLRAWRAGCVLSVPRSRIENAAKSKG